jgi:hypothetical protein
MEGITIIVPYWKREESLKRLLSVYEKLDKNIFKIKVVQLAPTEKGFNSGKAQNIGIEEAETDWVLKNDVDCVGVIDLYNYAYQRTLEMRDNDYMIFGAQYLDDNGGIQRGGLICGNEYLVHKNAWKTVGKCPEWDGYFGEDYAFEYMLEKNVRPQFKVSDYDTMTVSSKIRDWLVIPKNRECFPHYFKHYPHPNSWNTNMINENRVRLYEVVKKLN